MNKKWVAEVIIPTFARNPKEHAINSMESKKSIVFDVNNLVAFILFDVSIEEFNC